MNVTDGHTDDPTKHRTGWLGLGLELGLSTGLVEPNVWCSVWLVPIQIIYNSDICRNIQQCDASKTTEQ